MKAKLVLTKEQVDLLAGIEEKILRAKFEKDLASIRKKYEFVEVDVQALTNEKTKLTDEQFNQYLEQGFGVRKIAELSGCNEAYIYKMKKRILLEKEIVKEK